MNANGPGRVAESSRCSATPARVPLPAEIRSVTSLAMKGLSSRLLDQDGALYCWGESDSTLKPKRNKDLPPLAEFAVHDDRNCAITRVL